MMTFKRFSELFSFLPKSKNKASVGIKNGNYPFYTSSPFMTKYVNNPDIEVSQALIFGTGGNPSIHYATGKFSTSTDCYTVKSKDQSIMTKYVYYFLSGNIHILESGFKGAGLKHISKSYLQDITIPIFPLPQQKKIISILDAASHLIEQQKNLVGEYELFLKSKFMEMFGDPLKNPMGWETVSLESIIIDLQNGLYKPASDYTVNGTPILRIDGFYNGKVVSWKKLKKVVVNEQEKKHYALSNGDIIINRVNSLEYLGKNAYIEALLEPTVYESNMMRLKVNQEMVNPLFLSKVLLLDYTYLQIMKKAKKAVNQASINQQDVKSITTFLPPIKLQNKYTKIVKQTEQLIQKEQQKLEKLQILYNTLTQQVFNGEIQ